MNTAQALEILALVAKETPAAIALLKKVADFSLEFEEAQVLQDKAEKMTDALDIDFLGFVECLCDLEVQLALEAL